MESISHNLKVSAAPHLHTQRTVTSIMLDVIIALLPAAVFGIFAFGLRALLTICVCIASCVLAEYIFCRLTKKASTLGDLSAIVTGLLLALNLPPTIPVYMAVIGSVFAIIVAKQLFGGIGKNFVNPALAGRCFMLLAWTGAMTTFIEPFMGSGADAVSSATPLAAMANAAGNFTLTIPQAFWGFKAGTIGEISGICLIVGFVYLLVRKVLTIRIPAAYILSFAVLTFFFGDNQMGLPMYEYTLLQVLSGGLLLGAFFMATDYTTTPVTFKGQIIFGIGCGVLTFLIRRFGGYPEGVSFSILLMNVASPLIEKYTAPKPFGYVKEKRRAAK